MQAKSDIELLREYAEGNCEAAFSELVSRHLDLVYSAAARQLPSPDLAGDVAQKVFSDLARKAPALVRRLAPSGSLPGWLYRSTRFEALTLVRRDRRRLARERVAMQDVDPTPDDSPDWQRIRPALDAAMADLNDSDRNAVLLRYFKDQDFRTLGTAFGISENAAQQRVIRALDRLRKALARHGVTTTSAALSVALAANAVQAAPAGLAATITGTALLGAAAAGATATSTLIMTTLQKTCVATALAAATGMGLYEAHQAVTWRNQALTLQERHASLSDEVQQLRQERDRATNRSSLLAEEGGRASANLSELLRLRNEVGLLRLRTNALARSPASRGRSERETPADDTIPETVGVTSFPRDTWKFVGFATPENVLQSYMWAKSCGDLETAFATATPELRQAIKEIYFKGKTDEEISATLVDSAKSQTGFRILRKMATADDQVIFQVHIEGTPETSYALLTLSKSEGEWRVSSAQERND